MSTASVEQFQKDVSGYLAEAQKGNEVLICQGETPIARLSPVAIRREPKLKAGWAKGKVQIHGDIINEPCIPLEDWGKLAMPEKK